MGNIMGAMGKAMNNAQGLTPGSSSQPPQQVQMPQMPPDATNATRCHKCHHQCHKILDKDFTGPSVNLSSLLNTYQDGPGNANYATST